MNQENTFAGSGTSPGCCQNPQCAQCCESGRTPSEKIGASPTPGYMISNGSITRDLNHNLPESPNAWTEEAQRIISRGRK